MGVVRACNTCLLLVLDDSWMVVAIGYAGVVVVVIVLVAFKFLAVIADAEAFLSAAVSVTSTLPTCRGANNE